MLYHFGGRATVINAGECPPPPLPRVVVVRTVAVTCAPWPSFRVHSYHLTKLGWHDVILLERDELTSGSTWHAAANIHG